MLFVNCKPLHADGVCAIKCVYTRVCVCVPSVLRHHLETSQAGYLQSIQLVK